MSTSVLTKLDHKLVVGIAELAVSNEPTVVLATYSLGSCLGVAIYDPVVRVGGLLHLMLPDSTIDCSRAAQLPAMFVDTGVPALFRAAYRLGAEKRRVIISVAGGAELIDSSGLLNIGRHNFTALAQLLRQHELEIHAREIGGLVNRTMSLHVATGEIRLKDSGQTREIVLCKSSTTT